MKTGSSVKSNDKELCKFITKRKRRVSSWWEPRLELQWTCKLSEKEGSDKWVVVGKLGLWAIGDPGVDRRCTAADPDTDAHTRLVEKDNDVVPVLALFIKATFNDSEHVGNNGCNTRRDILNLGVNNFSS